MNKTSCFIFQVLFFLMTICMPRGGLALELTECVDHFYTSPASITCQLLDVRVAEQGAHCTLVAQCGSRSPTGPVEQVHVLTVPPADMSILINKQGALMVGER
ncbi:hypothetical protein ACB035_10415 [Aeromonas sp. S12(2024)]|uniref:hypothetical protein n=1 Tax=Aeromonas sp. S12(2024) TaxID=3242885 RepID=UPI0035284C33